MDRYAKRIAWTSIVGLALSVYALRVELDAIEGPNGQVAHNAMCDLSERVSCTKVFHSSYGRGFGLIAPLLGDDSSLNQPNSVAGIGFYMLLLVLGFIPYKRSATAQLLLSAVSNALSVYLAYLLYFVLDDLCVVCVTLYAVNAVNLVWSWKRVALFDRAAMEANRRRNTTKSK